MEGRCWEGARAYGHGSALVGGKRLQLCNIVGRVVLSLLSRDGHWRTVIGHCLGWMLGRVCMTILGM